MVGERIVQMIVEALAQIPLPPEVETLQEAYVHGIRMALNSRIRVDGKDLEEKAGE